MPQLPSGKLVGLSADPLDHLLKNIGEGENFDLINKMKALESIFPYLEIIYFVEGKTDTTPANIQEVTGKLPTGLTDVSSGFNLSQKAELFADWPLAECQAFDDFIASDACQNYLRHCFDEVKRIRVGALRFLFMHYAEKLSFLTEYDELDKPEIDTYDLLAALGCINATSYSTSLNIKSPQAFERLSGMWSFFSAKLGLEDYEFDCERHPITIAEQIRKNAPLDQLTPKDKSWFDQQAVVEAIELWKHADEDLLAKYCPKPFTILQLAVAIHGN
ncbi:MAG: hypothetical protein ABL919_10475 [Methylococcales bacterium]|nr:hypothetical protein [Methylococcaceae bacterium]